MALIAMVIAAGASLYVTYLRSSCDEQAVEKAAAILIRQRNHDDHSYQFAMTASRNEVVRPVADLQQIVMDAQEVVVPGCMKTAKGELLNYMGTVIRAFAAYGAGETDTTIRDLIQEAQSYYDRFSSELEAVKACAPFCIR